MNVSKKIALGIAVSFFSNFAFSQSLQEGIISIDSHKYAKAKKNFEDMVAKQPSAENYFYLGNSYLSQDEPDFVKAQEYFNKGLSVDKKSYLNQIGLATVKLGKGDKNGITEIQNIVKDSKEKDAEVLFRAGEALTMFEKNNSPDLAINFLEKAIEKAQKTGIPANYYYSLGDAYRIKRIPGNAMTAYEKALPSSKNKASVYTRMATLWMAAQKWQLAKENIDKAISADPTYAPVYKAKAGYDMIYQNNSLATQDLINYAKYADEDPYTQLEIAKLFFTSDDYANAKTTLDKVFDKVNDPIKFKLRSYIMYGEADYAGAKQNMDTFLSKAEKSRVYPSDEGLQGLIIAGLAKDEKDVSAKATAMAQAQQKIAIAKAAKDETFKWDEELAKIKGGGGASQAKADSGPSNPTIENLKTKVAANPQDTDAIYNLAIAYQDAKNWDGAILTWQKMNNVLPDWAPGYYSLGYAYQQAGNNELANLAYEKFIAKVKPEEVAANKETLAYAYFIIAYFVKDTDSAKAKSYILKSLEMNPDNKEAQTLSNQLN